MTLEEFMALWFSIWIALMGWCVLEIKVSKIVKQVLAKNSSQEN